MSVQSFKGLGWFLCGVIVAPACYMVNSHGAAEQARLNGMKGAIYQAQKDIRSLETEFQTRANLAQIERWNGDVLALAAPAPGQYLSGETALASLDQPAQIQNASLIVPTGAPSAQPVAAVATASAQPVQAAPAVQTVSGKSVAQQDRELHDLMQKADKRVAMVDKGVLSTSTIDDLKKLAQREKLALR
ncbi:hypothetical protein HZY97_14075 [Sphingomonas sp. R-74633]|uniref:hypothetical protein n=1 Tax=Sphingomonas sp. R-74633 TaxID=2751188 RepID=UPI0015D3A6F0|nr:hypothetical protein [Sphingomonas sp. R-74633]NYT41894.1 hypothetical protein [Sphingomonas sp. R-74633]